MYSGDYMQRIMQILVQTLCRGCADNVQMMA
jgi:hypothetical protein